MAELMKFLSADQIDLENWCDYVVTHPCGSIFHTPYVYKVFDKTPHHVPFAFFAVSQNDNKIRSMLSGFVQTLKPGLFSGMSTRAIIMQSPLYDDVEILGQLLNYYSDKIKSRAVYSEIRNHTETNPVKQFYADHSFSWVNHLNILIDLTLPEEYLWNQIHSKRRNEIRKAQKSGVMFRKLSLLESPDAYHILQEVYHRAKLPLLPYTFFENAMKMSTPDTGMEAFGAYLEDKLIGTMITMIYKKKVIDLFAGSLSEYYHAHPNDLIPWEVMKHYKDQGYVEFDFGGAGIPGVPYGVRDYKAKFGGRIVDYGRYQAVHAPIKFAVSKMAFKMLQKVKSVYATKA